MAFCIFEFIGPTKDIAVVHKNWLFQQKCYWPPFWKTSSLLLSSVKNGMIPDKKTWSLYEGHVVGNHFYETYDLARRHLEAAEITSDVSANEQRQRRRTREVTKPMHDSDSDMDGAKETPHRRSRGIQKRKICSSFNDLTSLPTPPALKTNKVDTHPFSQASALGTTANVASSPLVASKIPTLVTVEEMSRQEAIRQERGRLFDSGSTPSQVPQGPNTNYSQHCSSEFDSRNFPNMDGFDRRNDLPDETFLPGNVTMSDLGVGPNVFDATQIPYASNTRGYQPTEFNQPAGFLPTPPFYDSDAIRSLQRGQQIIAAKLDIALDMLRTIMSGRTVENTVVNHSISLPLYTIDEFFGMESDIRKNKQLKDDVIAMLSTKGGNNPNQITYRIVDSLMTNELMVNFTFAGQTGKRCFKDTIFVQFICEAVRRCPKGSIASDKDIEKAIEYWLKKSSTRIKRRRARASEGMQSIEELDVIPETP